MYIVEGNIGAGKSTFLTLINQIDPSINIILEPKDNWANHLYGQSLLANFYQDPSRWAYTLETLAMKCRARDHLAEQQEENPARIIERSIYSGHYCFALNHYESGYLNDIEWEIYQKWVNFLLLGACKPPHGFIYLQATPETCFTRVKKRNRSSEQRLTMAYMRNIHDRHEQFLIQKKGLPTSIANVPLLVLDCNEDFLANPHVMKNHISKVKEFFNKTAPAAQKESVLSATL